MNNVLCYLVYYLWDTNTNTSILMRMELNWEVACGD